MCVSVCCARTWVFRGACSCEFVRNEEWFCLLVEKNSICVSVVFDVSTPVLELVSRNEEDFMG